MLRDQKLHQLRIGWSVVGKYSVKYRKTSILLASTFSDSSDEYLSWYISLECLTLYLHPTGVQYVSWCTYNWRECIVIYIFSKTSNGNAYNRYFCQENIRLSVRWQGYIPWYIYQYCSVPKILEAYIHSLIWHEYTEIHSLIWQEYIRRVHKFPDMIWVYTSLKHLIWALSNIYLIRNTLPDMTGVYTSLKHLILALSKIYLNRNTLLDMTGVYMKRTYIPWYDMSIYIPETSNLRTFQYISDQNTLPDA